MLKDALSVIILLLGLYQVNGQGQNATDPPAPATPTGPTVTEPTRTRPPSKMYKLDENKFNTYKTKVCPMVPKITGESSTLPEWSDELSSDEVFELALVNLGYGLNTDAIAQMPTDLGNKRKIVDLIAHIAKVTCRTPAISPNFLNAAKNLFLYYLIKRERAGEAGGDPPPAPAEEPRLNYKSNKTVEWDEIVEAITQCAVDVTPMPIKEDCGELFSFIDKRGDEQQMTLIKEEMDEMIERNKELGLDLIIDSMWWMFTTAYARCYIHFYPDEDVILTFYLRFRDDILRLFADRWVHAGQFREQFSIIFGPVGSTHQHKALRTCATAAYNYEDMNGRHLVRPVLVQVNGVDVRNFKLNYN